MLLGLPKSIYYGQYELICGQTHEFEIHPTLQRVRAASADPQLL